MRGKEVLGLVVGAVLGITPAYAGKRQFCPPAGRADKDHPRVCGEKRENALDARPRRGITPACAGKSAAIPVTRRCGRDHPRMCGEKTTGFSSTTGF